MYGTQAQNDSGGTVSFYNYNTCLQIHALLLVIRVNQLLETCFNYVVVKLSYLRKFLNAVSVDLTWYQIKICSTVKSFTWKELSALTNQFLYSFRWIGSYNIVPVEVKSNRRSGKWYSIRKLATLKSRDNLGRSNCCSLSLSFSLPKFWPVLTMNEVSPD